MKWYKLVARMSHASFRFLKKLTLFLDALFSGFWLGIMGRKSLVYSDELYHSCAPSYSDEKYNESGFFDWEKPYIEKYFCDAKNVLLIAAGGGREVIALSKMGIKVDGYECNLRLVEFGNSLLKKHDINSSIKYLVRNSVPDDIKQYDGIIIGWGAYSLIRGNETRIGFLNSLKPFFKPETLLMASFVYSTRRRRKDKIIKQVADFLSFFHKKDRTEIGDRLVPYFIHYFSEDEIKSEFAQAGLDVIDYSGAGYGCLIARC